MPVSYQRILHSYYMIYETDLDRMNGSCTREMRTQTTLILVGVNSRKDSALTALVRDDLVRGVHGPELL